MHMNQMTKIIIFLLTFIIHESIRVQIKNFYLLEIVYILVTEMKKAYFNKKKKVFYNLFFIFFIGFRI